MSRVWAMVQLKSDTDRSCALTYGKSESGREREGGLSLSCTTLESVQTGYALSKQRDREAERDPDEMNRVMGREISEEGEERRGVS